MNRSICAYSSPHPGFRSGFEAGPIYDAQGYTQRQIDEVNQFPGRRTVDGKRQQSPSKPKLGENLKRLSDQE